MYLPPNEKKVTTLNPRGSVKDVLSWYENATPAFKKELFSRRTADEDIYAVATVIKKLPKVTIFSHGYNSRFKRHSNPQIVPNSDIKSIRVLKGCKDRVRCKDMVYVEWVDATHNNTPATVKDVAKDYGLVDICQFGFLMHRNKKRVFIGGRYNKEDKKYRFLEAVPVENIRKLVKLKG